MLTNNVTFKNEMQFVHTYTRHDAVAQIYVFTPLCCIQNYHSFLPSFTWFNSRSFTFTQNQQQSYQVSSKKFILYPEDKDTIFKKKNLTIYSLQIWYNISGFLKCYATLKILNSHTFFFIIFSPCKLKTYVFGFDFRVMYMQVDSVCM